MIERQEPDHAAWHIQQPCFDSKGGALTEAPIGGAPASRRFKKPLRRGHAEQVSRARWIDLHNDRGTPARREDRLSSVVDTPLNLAQQDGPDRNP